jgi:hypothetical protein
MSLHVDTPAAPLVVEAPPEARILFFGGQDPVPGPRWTRTRSRNLDCERLSSETGSQRYPGEISPARPRGGFGERETVVCRERILRAGLRSPLDEALLTDLQPTAAGLAETAAAVRPELAGATWLVEVNVPNPEVAAKVAFATKSALVEQGLSVTDRTPRLAVGDLEVITRMAPDDAYPTACVRWFATGALGPDDAILTVLSRDPRETVLHAGVCVGGQWSWLR